MHLVTVGFASVPGAIDSVGQIALETWPRSHDMTATRELRAEPLKFEVIISGVGYANRGYSGGKTKDGGVVTPCDDHPAACGTFCEFLRAADVVGPVVRHDILTPIAARLDSFQVRRSFVA